MTTRAIIDGQMATNTFLTGSKEVAQNVETRLKTFFGECFLENTVGTPWFQTILGKGQATEFDKESAIKKVIIETRGVEKLTSFSMVLDGFSYTVTASLIADDSEEQITVTV